MAHDAVAAMVVRRHGLPKRSEPAYRQVLLAVGILAKGLHHGLGYGKRRLAEAQVEDLSALSDERGGAFVRGQGGRRRQPAHVEIEVHGRHVRMMRVHVIGRRDPRCGHA